jgi:hypothetical protein
MARAKSFAITRTGDRTLDSIQQAAADVFAQLEDARRGLLASAVVTAPGDLQLGENLIVLYTGPGGHRFTLPAAAQLGTGRGQALLLSNAGAGNLTVTASGNELVNGAATLVLAAGASAVVFSDGAAAWRAVT